MERISVNSSVKLMLCSLIPNRVNALEIPLPPPLTPSSIWVVGFYVIHHQFHGMVIYLIGQVKYLKWFNGQLRPVFMVSCDFIEQLVFLEVFWTLLWSTSAQKIARCSSLVQHLALRCIIIELPMYQSSSSSSCPHKYLLSEFQVIHHQFHSAMNYLIGHVNFIK